MPMGMTYVSVELTGSIRSEVLDLLVDSGSLYTWAPRAVLERLGVTPVRRRTFRTIEGRDISREVGEAFMEISGEKGTRIVVFAEGGDANVLGADTL